MDLACGVRTLSTAHDYGIGLGYLKFAYRGRSSHDSVVHFATDSVGRKCCWRRCVRAGAYGIDFSDSQKGRVSGSDLFNQRKLLQRPMLLNNRSNDSIAYIGHSREDTDVIGGDLVDEKKSPMEESEAVPVSDSKSTSPLVEEKDACQLDELRELLQKAIKELQGARLNSAMFEEKALKVSETAIALKDEAERARDDVNSALSIIQDIITEEDIAKEAVWEPTMALSMVARLRLALGSIDFELEQRTSQDLLVIVTTTSTFVC